MSDLVSFLRVRLDEDEAVAKAAGSESSITRAPGVWEIDTNDSDAFWNGREWEFGENASAWHGVGRVWRMWGARITLNTSTRGKLPTIQHIASHDPARVLREVAAKRAILAEHDPGHDPCDAHDASLRTIPCDTLLHLAAVWSGHPDYDPTWDLS